MSPRQKPEERPQASDEPVADSPKTAEATQDDDDILSTSHKLTAATDETCSVDSERGELKPEKSDITEPESKNRGVTDLELVSRDNFGSSGVCRHLPIRPVGAVVS